MIIVYGVPYSLFYYFDARACLLRSFPLLSLLPINPYVFSSLFPRHRYVGYMLRTA